MKTVVWTDQTPWNEVLAQCEREEVVVTRGGHAVAILSPFDDDDMKWYSRENDTTFLESIAEARRQVRQGMTIGHADLRRELGIDQGEEAMNLDGILDALDRLHQRATYAAVGGVISVIPQAVMRGRPQTRRHSWVVAKKTLQPTGFDQNQKHVNLEERKHVIVDAEELRGWLRSPR